MRAYWGKRYVRVPYWPPRSLWPGIACSLGTRALGLTCLQRWTKSWWLRNRPLDTWYDDRLDDALRHLLREKLFDVVIVEYAIWSRALTLFERPVLKVIDTHDVFTDRYKLLSHSDASPVFWPWGSVSLSARDEKRALDRADVVIAIQSQEAERLRSVTRSRVVTVGHLLTGLKAPCNGATGHDMLFVGSAWVPNVDGMRWFIREVLPKVRRQVPSARLLVAGHICRELPAADGCVKLWFVDDLEQAYRQAAVVVNPVGSGTGLPIKSIEALGFGRALVSCPSGARGLEDAIGHGLIVAQSVPEWVDNLSQLLADGQTAAKTGDAAYRFAQQWNARQCEELQMLLTRPATCQP
jgi:glycosyltransferase involved in cell wall biosynthesis